MEKTATIGYLWDDYKVKELPIMLPKTKAYVKSYDSESKCMYSSAKNDDLLAKHNILWDKLRADINKICQ